MVPNAPWISPIWAASRTAARAFSGLTRMFMVCLLAGPGRRRPLRRLSRSYAPMRRFEIADRVRLQAPDETLEANSAGRLGPSFMFRVPSVCRRASQGRLRIARASLRNPGANEPTAGGVAPPAHCEQAAPLAPAVICGPATRSISRPAIAGEIDDVVGELVHGSPPLWFLSKAGRRAAGRLGLTDDSRTGFRPVDAREVLGRRIGEPVRERAARDGTAHVSSVGLMEAGRNESQADTRLNDPSN